MNRTPILLVALLLVLAAIVMFVIPSGDERESSYQATPISLKVDSASIVKVEIQRPAKSITIENVGGKWTITSPGYYAADPNAVTRVIGGLARLKIGSLISSNPEKANLFQVDSMGTRLTVSDRSGHTASVIIGKMGPSYAEVYFRMPNSKDVYLAEGLDTWTLNKDLKDWRDHTINSLPAETFKEVSYTIGPKQYTFEHDSTGWKTNGATVASTEISPLVNTLSSLRADDFADSSVQLTSQPINIALKGIASTSLDLYPILPDSARYYVRSSVTPQTFIVSKWTAQQLLKPIEKFMSASKAGQHQVATVAPTKKTEPRTKPVTVAPPSTKKEERVAATQQPTTTQKRVEEPTTQKPQESSRRHRTAPTLTPPSTQETPAPGRVQKQVTAPSSPTTEDEGDLTVHTVTKGETMQSIAQKYHTTVDQILKWNLLKTIAVRPGQELYIYVKK
jgi:LysM repeat protein